MENTMEGCQALHMKQILIFITVYSAAAIAQEQTCAMGKANVTIAMHEGLGEIWFTPEVKQQRKDLMKSVLAEAREKLEAGALAVDVVEEAISKFEDSGLFNTGKGGAANSAGE